MVPPLALGALQAAPPAPAPPALRRADSSASEYFDAEEDVGGGGGGGGGVSGGAAAERGSLEAQSPRGRRPAGAVTADVVTSALSGARPCALPSGLYCCQADRAPACEA